MRAFKEFLRVCFVTVDYLPKGSCFEWLEIKKEERITPRVFGVVGWRVIRNSELDDELPHFFLRMEGVWSYLKNVPGQKMAEEDCLWEICQAETLKSGLKVLDWEAGAPTWSTLKKRVASKKKR